MTAPGAIALQRIRWWPYWVAMYCGLREVSGEPAD